MKKIVLISFFFIATLTSFSQTNKGFSVGSNFAFLTGDSIDLPMNHMKSGIYAGVFWDITTGYKTYIQIGGFFSQQGAQYKNEYFDYGKKVTQIIKYKIDYIKIPISWKQVWGDWYTVLGLYGEFAVNSNAIWKEKIETATDLNIETDTLQSFTNNLRFYDTGVNLSIGVQTPLSNQYDFFFNVAYNHGLLAINPSTFLVHNKMSNRFFSISVGIILRGDKYKYRSRN